MTGEKDVYQVITKRYKHQAYFVLKEKVTNGNLVKDVDLLLPLENTPPLFKVDLDQRGDLILDLHLAAGYRLYMNGLIGRYAHVHKTKRGFHIRGTTAKDVDHGELILVQALLHSDIVRELNNYIDLVQEGRFENVLYNEKYTIEKDGESVLIHREEVHGIADYLQRVIIRTPPLSEGNVFEDYPITLSAVNKEHNNHEWMV